MAECNGKHNDEAFITLATNDVYSRGALVLAESLKKYGTSRKLVIMITPHVTPSARAALDDVFDDVRLVDVLDSRDAAHLALLKRPELGITFTKIHCWTLTEYKKCVFMDADMMALQNIDELFEREELSASPDSGWPDIFNSGLFVFRPSLETFNGLLLLAQNEGSFDGGDQGLLNTYFKDWATKDISRHLPFLYNLHVSASYTYLPAFKRFGKDTKVVHFLGPVKPWHHVYNRVTGGVQQIAGPMQSGTQHLPQYLSEWWALYNDRVQKYFSKEQEMRDHVCMESHETIKEQNYQQTAEEDTQTHEHRQEQHQDSSIAEDSPPCDDEHPSYTSPPRPRSPSPPPNPYHWSPPATFYREQPSCTKEPPPLPKPEPPPSPKPESSPPPKPESSPHPKSEPLSPPKPEPSRILKTEPPQSPIHEQPRPATPPRESQPEILSPRTPPRDKTSPPPSEPHRTPEEHPPTRSETSTTSNQKVDTSNRRTKRKHKTVLPDSQYYDLYMYSRPFQFASLTRSLNKESSSSQDRKHKRTPPRENAIKTRMVSCIRGANFWC